MLAGVAWQIADAIVNPGLSGTVEVPRPSIQGVSDADLIRRKEDAPPHGRGMLIASTPLGAT